MFFTRFSGLKVYSDAYSLGNPVTDPTRDLDHDGMPDALQPGGPDLDFNGVADSLQAGGPDLDGNGVPDSMQATGVDLDHNNMADHLQPGGPDLDGNGIADRACLGPRPDCRRSGRCPQGSPPAPEGAGLPGHAGDLACFDHRGTEGP